MNPNYLSRDDLYESYGYLGDYLSDILKELETDHKFNSSRSYSIPGRFSTFDGDGFNFYFNPMFMKYFFLK